MAQSGSLPGVTEEEQTLDFWLQRLSAEIPSSQPDAPVLGISEIADHNQALLRGSEEGPQGQMDLGVGLTEEELGRELTDRLTYMHERVEDGRYVSSDGAPIEAAAFAPPEALPEGTTEVRVTLEPLDLRCAPYAQGLFTEPVDERFNRNACSRIPAQEPVEVLREWPAGMLWVRTRFASGWLSRDAALSPALSEEDAERVLSAHRAEALPGASAEREGVQPFTLMAFDAASSAFLVAGERGLRSTDAFGPHEVRVTKRALTREHLLTEAFRHIDGAYGWGGREGGRDCSRLMMDLFDRFDLGLPRHSGMQAQAGTFSIDLTEVESMVERQLLLDSAHTAGITLLYFPGHIMLYLGRGEHGEPRALHSLGEYFEACPGGESASTRRDVHRVVVSGLDLGAGTERGSFLERMTRLVVIGGRPELTLQGVAQSRPAAPVVRPEPAACSDSQRAAMFRSPRRPNAEMPLRVVVTLEDDPGPVELALFSPSGERITPTMRALGAPPWTFWSSLESPEAGTWTAVLGDGERVVACESFRVHSRRRRGRGALLSQPWRPVWRWEMDTENFYSAFVEQLFRAPEGEDLTWPNLQVLLDDPERNLLRGHLGRNDDADLRLHPDCADLPYFLRAYFAWKLQLPFAYRRCNRGRAGRAPTCGQINSAAELFEAEPPSAPPAGDTESDVVDEPVVPRFDEFTRGRDFLRAVASGVHSGTARTAPGDDDTDLYPVPLTRQTLRPGTVYADPYGHLLVIARWRPQGIGDDYGVLIGADAQPDATVGRRRFWRGSFLFSTDTSSAGAGFKAWRPLVYRGSGRPLQIMTNAELEQSDAYYPWSSEQYAGSVDDFYGRMEELINPRALDAAARLSTLVDALHESVLRRVNSVNNGITFMQGRSWRVVDMPRGYSIFETSGPWEDYSSPSRDMRLLISLDAVLGFPARVAERPERFGVDPEGAEAYGIQLREQLGSLLEERGFSYQRSDGSEQGLTLADVASRAADLEMAYNPNDCAEIRWAAPTGSAEASTCQQHAPAAQSARMREYRPWFVERTRPPR